MSSSKTASSPSKTFTLFVVLPSEDVCTLRNLTSGITVGEIKDRLELSAGLPSNIYILVYPDGEFLLDNQRLLVQENIRDGYLLKVQFLEQWDSLYQAVMRNNFEQVYHNGGVHLKGNIVVGTHETETVDHLVSDRGTVALFVAGFYGYVRMCKMLLSVGVDVNGVTPFGRTALHACVCRDNIAIAEVLLNYGASPDRVDIHGISPYSTACLFSSRCCVKRLRVMQLNLRGRTAQSAHNSASMEKGKFIQRPKEISKITLETGLPLKRPSTVHCYQSFPRSKSSLSVLSSDPSVYSYFASSVSPKTKLSCLNYKMQNTPYGNLRVCYKPDVNVGPQYAKYFNLEKTSEDRATPVQGKKIGTPSEKMMKSTPGDDGRRSTSPIRMIPDVRLPSTAKTPSTSPSPTGEIKEGFDLRDQKSKRARRFSAKERSCSSLQRPEHLENMKTMKRRINIAANHSNKEEIEVKSGEAHKEWLKRKTKENIKFKPETPPSDSDDSDSSEENSAAFVEWLNKKKHSQNNSRSFVRGGRPLPGLVTIGSTEEGEIRIPDPNINIRSYRNWVDGRKRSKKRHNLSRMNSVDSFMAEQRILEEKRQKLLISAVSYEEWMDHSEDRKTLIREILQANLQQLKAIEAEQLRRRAPKQIAFGDWKERVTKREENEKLKTELQLKYQQEKDKWRKEMFRTTRAISHQDWMRLKSGHDERCDKERSDQKEDGGNIESKDRIVYDNWLDTKHIEEINTLQSQIQEERKVIETYQQRVSNLISCQ